MDRKKSKRGRRWPKGTPLTPRLPVVLKIGGSEDKFTAHDAIYNQLRSMILHGEVSPGDWLRQEELTQSLGVSRTPVREALRSLNQEGLVDLMPNYGARVSLLSMEEFEELYALRGGIEGLAARLAVQALTEERLEGLRTRMQELDFLAENADIATYLKEEWLFRVYLFETTGRESLLWQVKSLRERAERYLRLAYTVEGRVEESLLFHKRLLEACEGRNGAEAEKIVQQALRWTLEKAGPIIAAEIEDED